MNKILLANETGVNSSGSAAKATRGRRPGSGSKVEIPKDLAVNADGDVVTGTGASGYTVIVAILDGYIIGKGVVNPDGTFSIELNNKTDGGDLRIRMATPEGKESPDIIIRTNEHGEMIVGKYPDSPSAEVTADGKSVVGKAEPGNTIEVKLGHKVIGVAEVDDNGDYQVTLDRVVLEGDTVEVVAKDALGNPSKPVLADSSTDVTPPEAPVAELDFEGEIITGKSEKGATIIIKDSEGQIIVSKEVDENGDFRITLDTAITDGDSVVVIAQDTAGNDSKPTGLTGLKDTINPDSPTAELIMEGYVVEGSVSEPSIYIIVTDSEGKILSQEIAGEDGLFRIVLDEPITDGNTIKVYAKDLSDNVSEGIELIGDTDTKAPAKPEVEIDAEGVVVSGTAEKDSFVEVTFKGEIIGTAQADENGQFTVNLSVPVTDNEVALVVARDSSGNTSEPAEVQGSKDTIPPIIESATITHDGDVVTGKTEANAVIQVTDGENVLGKGFADEEGNFIINISPAITDGNYGLIFAGDKFGNVSDSTVVIGEKDTVAPYPPDASINADGTIVTGYMVESNVTIEVRDSNNQVIGTAKSDKYGRYEVKLSIAVTDFNIATVVAIDSAGNQSLPTEVVGQKDTIAPDSPDATLSKDGKYITGTTEPNTTVYVKNEAGVIIKTAFVDDSGYFSIELDKPITDGATVDVVAQDWSGHISEPTQLTGNKDTIAPIIESAEIDDDGLVVTGKADEAGSIIQVKQGDLVLGEAVADSDGNFIVHISPALTDMAKADVIAIDGANNVSEPIVVIGEKDTIAPIIEDPEINDEGLVVTGKTEPDLGIEVVFEGVVVGKGKSDSEGNFSVTLDKAVTDNKVAEIFVKDNAGNISEAAEVVGERDTIAPNRPSATISSNGGEVTGQTEPNAKIIIKDAKGNILTPTASGEEIFADVNGHYSVTLDPKLQDGEIISVYAEDQSENTSLPTTVTAGVIDEEAPVLSDVKINNEGTEITGKTEAHAKIIVKDGDVIVSTVYADEHGNFIVVVDPALTDNKELDVYAEDIVGNISDPTTVIGYRDTIAPDAPDAEFAADDVATLTVKSKEGDVVIKIYDSEGNPILDNEGNPFEHKTDANGVLVYTFDPAIVDGKLLNITATDVAGNESVSIQVVAGVGEIVVTTDNEVDFVLSAKPHEAVNQNPSSLDKTGFSIANIGLGPVLNADILGDALKNSVILEVGENQTRDVTLHADLGGVTVLATMDLLIYKFNESTQEWQQQSVRENWVFSGLLFGRSKDLNLTLPEGKWMFMLAGGEGIAALAGSSLKFTKDIVLDYNKATEITGEKSGNVIKDLDSKYGSDVVPEGSLVTHVDGKEIAPTLGTVIQGIYGQLTMKGTGEYVYTLNEGQASNIFGKKDEFTYTVTSPNGKTSESKLTFELNITEKEERIEIDEILLLNTEPKVIYDGKSDIKDAVGFSVLDVGLLGPVLTASALEGAGAMSFDVAENQVKELTFHGSVGGVTVGSVFDLVIYKLDPASGGYVEVHMSKNWFFAVLLGGRSSQLTLQFGEGEYKALLQSKGGLSLLTGSGLYVDNEKVYDYNQPVKYDGKVSGDATADDSTIVLQAGKDSVEPGKETIVKGEYGELAIQADGTYTYTIVKPKNASADWVPPYGKVDSFQLVTKDANGKLIIETLNIKVGLHTANDDFNNITVTSSNFEQAGVVFVNDTKDAGYSSNKEFEILENQVAKTMNISISGDSNGIWWGEKAMELKAVLTNTTTGQKWEFSDFKVDAKISVSVKDLPAGKYSLSITSSSEGTIDKVNVTADLVHTDHFVAEVADPITGVLFANDAGKNMMDTLKFGNKQVSVNDPNQGAKSIEIEGEYGTLIVNKAGDYTYIPKGDVYGFDRFNYETISKVGTKENAVLEINVGKNIIASIYADTVSGSQANDTFTMGDGADTVIYKDLTDETVNLGGNGANGLDDWTDFNLADGDKIDVTQLLDGNQTAENIGDYLKYEKGVLSVDRLGNGNFEDMIKVDADSFEDLLGAIKWEVPVAAGRSIDLSNIESLSEADEAQGIAPFALTLDDLITSDESDEITFFSVDEAQADQFIAGNSNDAGLNASVLDVQPTVDLLDDLLDQKVTLI